MWGVVSASRSVSEPGLDLDFPKDPNISNYAHVLCSLQCLIPHCTAMKNRLAQARSGERCQRTAQYQIITAITIIIIIITTITTFTMTITIIIKMPILEYKSKGM